MKTTKFGCNSVRLFRSAGVLLALCAAFVFIACDFMLNKSPKLTVTAPAFSAATVGYSSESQTITIQNTGSEAALIESVTVTPDTAFTIVKGSNTVTANSSTNDWAVQLKPGLAAGTYEAVIIVTYKGSITIKTGAPLKFTVSSPL